MSGDARIFAFFLTVVPPSMRNHCSRVRSSVCRGSLMFRRNLLHAGRSYWILIATISATLCQYTFGPLDLAQRISRPAPSSLYCCFRDTYLFLRRPMSLFCRRCPLTCASSETVCFFLCVECMCIALFDVHVLGNDYLFLHSLLYLLSCLACVNDLETQLFIYKTWLSHLFFLRELLFFGFLDLVPSRCLEHAFSWVWLFFRVLLRCYLENLLHIY